jgi:type II secretory pathway predicted ATPase ExeA
MTRRPFRSAVDPASYFAAATHEAALAALAAAFARRDAVVLLDGPPGVGKSLVARQWLDALPAAVPRVVVPNAHAPRPADLLQAILFDLDQPYQRLGEQELRLAVTGQLLTTAGEHPTVLLLDEAQHLGAAAVEELRLLGNVETAGGGVLFVVLVAQPALRDALARPGYESFAQRVAVRCRIEPLTAEESAAYLRHQVAAAGGDPQAVFDDDAVSLLAGACGGVPRVLNQAAALAAELAAAGGAETIDVEAALEAVARLGLAAEPAEAEEPPASPHPVRSEEPVPTAPPPRRTGLNAEAGGDAASGRTPKQKPARKRSA